MQEALCKTTRHSHFEGCVIRLWAFYVYGCAGDQLLRKDMSEAQREQLTAILEDIYEGFTEGIAQSRGKSVLEV